MITIVVVNGGDCENGEKFFTGKYISRPIKNCFENDTNDTNDTISHKFNNNL